ncbi:hypothetical protein PPACK8108_LOCUS9976 [Phakopsora pachyrhizi]|uniref:Uncharacterized protein n=1 Tax=Phakopsora pachyrhizi TaxID=170000 RepID=A0AAV0AXI6_PHAPC|nr:hypothetical protein PPACK8108_LOCUS9976 [Phakopsora pachyrhizi]
MLEWINRIAQGIHGLQMSVNQGKSKGKMKVTGEGRDNTLLAWVCQHVATWFGKDLNMKKQIFLAPATRSERRLWRNDLHNDLDDDELSQSNGDIEGQDPYFHIQEDLVLNAHLHKHFLSSGRQWVKVDCNHFVPTLASP